MSFSLRYQFRNGPIFERFCEISQCQKNGVVLGYICSFKIVKYKVEGLFFSDNLGIDNPEIYCKIQNFFKDNYPFMGKIEINLNRKKDKERTMTLIL